MKIKYISFIFTGVNLIFIMKFIEISLEIYWS